MSKSKHTLGEAVLARMSLGAVPMDGHLWFDPKVLRQDTPADKPGDMPATVGFSKVKAPRRWLAKWWPLRRKGQLS